jgi:hypothetical protein
VPASLLLWVDGLFSYYCATPVGLIVHPDPFLTPIHYKWNDVRRLEVGCHHTKGGTSIDFVLVLNDDQRIDLGGDSWSMLDRNFLGVRRALWGSSYIYDNHQSKDCPANLQHFFATDPI